MPPLTTASSRLGSIAFYILVATIILAPLAFLPTPYISIDIVKTVLIAVGVLSSIILLGVHSYKQRTLVLPPRSLVWVMILGMISLILSALMSMHVGKSLFGQSFEVNTVGFIAILFFAGFAVFATVQQKIERAMMLYVGITASFLILGLFHVLRFAFGPEFATLSILQNTVSTVLGTWYDLAIYAVVIGFLTLSALIFLPLSRQMRIVYSTVLAAATICAFIINGAYIWFAATLVLIGFMIYMSWAKPRPLGGMISSFVRRIAWVPLLAVVVAGTLAWYGTTLATPLIEKMGAEYTSIELPWQLSLDIISGSIKTDPLFGVGPNHFSEAYIAFRPAVVNNTAIWNTEFKYAYGLIPTFVATQGMLGLVSWILLLVCLGIYGVRMLLRMPEDVHARFLIVSSVLISFFLWTILVVSVPSHVIIFFTWAITAIMIATGVHYGILHTWAVSPHSGTRMHSAIFAPLVIGSVVIASLGIVYYAKDGIALAYFGSGVRTLTISNDPVAADAAFARAYSLNSSDVYLRARAEVGIIRIQQIASTLTENASASTTEAVTAQVSSILNDSLGYAAKAITFDPQNYYNYLSQARVSEIAIAVGVEKAYENAANSYTQAIRMNPLNPTLYLNLARLQVSQKKLDEAKQVLGAAIQVKNDYLDAVFLLSQVSAAQGNLPDAIIAAQFATQINPQNSVLMFQLGLLQYNNKDYAAAALALEKAIEIDVNYANAQYFLGLSYARLGKNDDAITQFSRLADTNPENEEVRLILENLMAGKSPFADAKPPVTAAPEKRSSLPIKQK